MVGAHDQSNNILATERTDLPGNGYPFFSEIVDDFYVELFYGCVIIGALFRFGHHKKWYCML